MLEQEQNIHLGKHLVRYQKLSRLVKKILLAYVILALGGMFLLTTSAKSQERNHCSELKSQSYQTHSTDQSNQQIKCHSSQKITKDLKSSINSSQTQPAFSDFTISLVSGILSSLIYLTML